MTGDSDFAMIFRSISPKGAAALCDAAAKAANEKGVSGVVVVLGRNSTPEVSQAVGQAKAETTFADLALKKAITALNTGISTSKQRLCGEKKRQRMKKLALEGVRTLFKGGVPIYEEPECINLVGAIGFSGDTEEAEEICKQAVQAVGLFTDLEA